MKTTLGYFVLFTTSLLAGLSASVATSANAWFTRVHASACTPLSGTPFLSESGLHNGTGFTMTLLCPVHDHAEELKGSTTDIVMTVIDGSSASSVTAIACGAFTLVKGGICGAVVYSTDPAFVGESSLMVLPTSGVWVDRLFTGSYGYLAVSLPPRQSGGASSGLKGFQQSGT